MLSELNKINLREKQVVFLLLFLYYMYCYVDENLYFIVKVAGMRVARRRTSSGPGSEPSSKPAKPKETNGTIPNGDAHESASDATSTPASESVDVNPEKDKTDEQREKEERALRKRQQYATSYCVHLFTSFSRLDH